MKTLELTFKGSLGGKHVFKVHNAKEDLKEDAIVAAMKSLAALGRIPLRTASVC